MRSRRLFCNAALLGAASLAGIPAARAFGAAARNGVAYKTLADRHPTDAGPRKIEVAEL